jgi:transcriptional regulator with XRE-family HTH domain
MEIDPIRDRILQIMEHEGFVPSKFAEEIGIQRSAMSHITSGRNKPSLDVIMKILERFTYVDSDWLMFGKGNMIHQTVSVEPDLFKNTAVNPPEVQATPEYRKENRVETHTNDTKHTVSEQIIHHEKTIKTVSKIMIFYTDNTFETFIPEKIKKD